MTIEKKIKLKDNIYFIGVEVKYIKEDSIIHLVKQDNTSFDSGDLSILIEDIESNYSSNKYNTKISLLDDIFYIYDTIPYISYIKSVYINKNNEIYGMDILSKEEIQEYLNLIK